jgi:glutamate dehydrogenase/leucine dehydrogenase
MRAAVAVHSTVLGPALGGTRFRAYPDEASAVLDVCRLARGMTYKHAVCGNDQGGGKAVLIGDPATVRTEALIEAYARFVDRLGGSGDPSPATAWGVRWAMAAVGERLWGMASLEGRHVVVLGTGKVGSALARHLHDDGARLTLADVRTDSVAALAAELGAAVVDPAAALEVQCDVLSPCALGAVLDERSIARLRCAAVCGAANNQLATDADGERLAAAGILYVPDYVANAGGVVNIAEETAPGGYDADRARARVEQIAGTVRRVFALADEHGIVPAAAADRLAEARLSAGA